MALSICGIDIQTIAVVDDDRNARDMYELPLEELEVAPYLVDGPLRDLPLFLDKTIRHSQAAICDHHLRVGSYASFDGAELVAKCYRQNFPAILCTRMDESGFLEFRKYRKYIPVLINPDQLDPEIIVSGIEQCIKEFKDIYKDTRKKWRALVRIEDLLLNENERNSFAYVVVPNWAPNKVLRLMLSDLPQEVRDYVVSGGARLHAQINIGAESQNELYFDEWELS